MSVFRPLPEVLAKGSSTCFFITNTDPNTVVEGFMCPCHTLGVLYVARNCVERAGEKGLDFNRVL